MTQPDKSDPQPSVQDVVLIVGGGPGISSSCARLFAENGMRVSIAARNPDKSVLQTLEKVHGVRRYACGAIFKVFCSRRERRKMFLEIT
jgi:NAD(P)-dependent dehydrogenase (short-subunit alcohol dehydrogenase family)